METSNLTKKRIQEFLKEGKRFDNRKLEEFRKIEIEIGISKNAEGSAKVKYGNTEVVAGVKIDVGEPYTDHEEEGTLITTAELLPLSSPKFEPGPPKIEAIEIARIVDRGIRESGFVDFKKLCIEKGEKVYNILLDIYSINDEGNLIDAACFASVIALLSAKMPKYDEKTGKIKFGEFTSKSLPLTGRVPLTITFHKIKDQILVDPIIEEEDASEARISFALSRNPDKKNEILINAAQKGGDKRFKEEEIYKIIDLAVAKFKELEKNIKIQEKK